MASRTIDWAKLSAEMDLPARLLARATRRLNDEMPARAACRGVMERLAADDWSAMRDTDHGERSPAQHLQHIAGTLLRDEVRRCADWPALFFGATLAERLNAEANRRFGRTPDAESAYNYALECVSADDWRKPREGYRGEGNAEGFLRVTFLNLLEEYRVRKYGKRRPPEWVRRLGWEQLYRMYCLQRMEVEEIVSLLVARAEAKAADIRQAVREIGARVRNCRQAFGEVPVPDNHLETRHDDTVAGTPASRVLEQADLSALLEILRVRVTGSPGASVPAGTPNPLAALADAFALEDRDILLMRLIYHEGLSIPKAAQAMRPPMHEQAARRLHRKLVARIRDALTAAGFEASTV